MADKVVCHAGIVIQHLAAFSITNGMVHLLYGRLEFGELGIRTQSNWDTFRHTNSTLLRGVGTEFKVM